VKQKRIPNCSCFTQKMKLFIHVGNLDAYMRYFRAEEVLDGKKPIDL
jgi:hypothetical protein